MKREQHNMRIREALKRKGLYLWQLGKILNYSEAWITRLMRDELPEKEQDRIIELIERS